MLGALEPSLKCPLTERCQFVVIVDVDILAHRIAFNTNAANANTRAVMFHLGKFIPTGVPDTFGFNGVDTTASTGDTAALIYSNGTPGLESVVKFRWNGNGVELIGNAGKGWERRALVTAAPTIATARST